LTGTRFRRQDEGDRTCKQKPNLRDDAKCATLYWPANKVKGKFSALMRWKGKLPIFCWRRKRTRAPSERKFRPPAPVRGQGPRLNTGKMGKVVLHPRTEPCLRGKFGRKGKTYLLNCNVCGTRTVWTKWKKTLHKEKSSKTECQTLFRQEKGKERIRSGKNGCSSQNERTLTEEKEGRKN